MSRRILANRFSQELKAYWRSLRFGPVTVETQDEQHRFCIAVFLGALSIDSVRIELFVNSEQGNMPETHLMTPHDAPCSLQSSQTYFVEFSASGQQATIRLAPSLNMPMPSCVSKRLRYFGNIEETIPRS